MPLLDVVRITRREDLRSRDADWISLCRHPEAHPAFIEAVCEAGPTIVRPHVVLVYRDQMVVGLAVARIERMAIPIRFGLATLAAPRLDVVKLSYDGIIGESDSEVLAALLDALFAPLRGGEADAILFDHVRVGSLAERAAALPGRRGIRDLSPIVPSIHWATDLPGSYEEFLTGLSKNARGSVRNNEKRTNKALGSRLRVVSFRGEADLGEIVRRCEAVARRTYHRTLGVGFADDPLSVALARVGLSIGALRCFVLIVDDEPKAFWTGLAWRGTFYTTTTGYDPELGGLGIGGYLLHQIIAELCVDPTVSRIDFGLGHADYKQRLCEDRWEEAFRLVFAPRPKPIAVNVVRAVGVYAALAGDRLLRKLGVRDRLKARWWRRVAAPPTPTAADRSQSS